MDSKHLELVIHIARIKHLHQQQIRYKSKEGLHIKTYLIK